MKKAAEEAKAEELAAEAESYDSIAAADTALAKAKHVEAGGVAEKVAAIADGMGW